MIGRMPRSLLATLVVSLALVQPAGGQREQNARPRGAWMQYGASADSSRYVALSQITKTNVTQLEVAWTYPTRDSRVSLFNPIVVDGVMYVLARDSSLVALDAATGREIWIHAAL